MNKNLAIATAVIIICIFVQMSFAAQMSVVPAYQEVLAGKNFTVDIYVDPEGNETYGAQYWLYFNNTLLKAISQIKGPFLGNGTHEWANETNNTLGIIKYSESRQKPVITGVTTPGILATITFKAMEPGMSSLNLSKVKLTDPDTMPIPDVLINNGTVETVQPSTPFLINGYFFYKNDTKCNKSIVSVTNMNTSNNWVAETNVSSNYYLLMLSSNIDINARETLQFEVTSQDGSQSNITSHTITLEEINNGGLFDFNITLEAKPGIFDTEAPDNPYPSIFGVHNGAIIPDRRIEANRIYTYPCAGTGGHTEFVRIWGSGVDAHANWSGYIGDWHNLTFNTTFTLEQGVEYNYTIRTGSYPQIIHAHSEEYSATGGKIRCDEFSDANGMVRKNWIPAFRLWRQVE